MSYIDDSLSEGEHLIARFPLSNWIWAQVLLSMAGYAAVVVTLIAIQSDFAHAFRQLFSWIALAVALMGAITVGISVIRILVTEQGVTNWRVIRKVSIISREAIEVNIRAVESAPLRQSLIGRLLNFGDVRITGRGTDRMRMKFISNPLDAKKKIEETIGQQY